MSVVKEKVVPYVMWLLPVMFFSYQFILRLWPSVMMDQIMHQYAIDATAFGVLASLYYYGYAGMQIPLAMALDKFGPRLVVCFSALVCAFATFMFTYTDYWPLAMLSRLLVGVGSAVGFLASSKVISQWFTKRQYARMVGITFSLGLLGAIYGGKPISLLVGQLGWQHVAYSLGAVSAIIGLLTFVFLKSPKTRSDDQTQPFKLEDLKTLLKSKVIWLLALGNLLMVGSLEGFADVWGVNYLVSCDGMLKSEAAKLVSMIFVGMLFGGPLLAVLSKRFGYFTVISCCGFGMSALLMYLLMSDHLISVLTYNLIFFSMGLMCCYQVLMFALGCDMVSKPLLGVTVAFLNSINMLGGSFFHTAIGRLMDWYWIGELNDGLRIYSHQTYEKALLLIPVCAIIGAVIIALVGYRLNASNKAKGLIGEKAPLSTVGLDEPTTA